MDEECVIPTSFKSNTVEVVYMTTKPKTDLPTHVYIESALRPSTLLCEQISTVSEERIGAKRVYIINVVSDKNYKPSAILDQCLVEIPMLIREDGTVCYENLHMIRKEDFENVN